MVVNGVDCGCTPMVVVVDGVDGCTPTMVVVNEVDGCTPTMVVVNGG
jgi:hypothetical protein